MGVQVFQLVPAQNQQLMGSSTSAIPSQADVQLTQLNGGQILYPQGPYAASQTLAGTVVLSKGGKYLAVYALNTYNLTVPCTVYVFTLDLKTGLYTQVVALNQSVNSTTQLFSSSLAMDQSGEFLVVGSPGEGPNAQGVVRVYQRFGKGLKSDGPC